MHRGPDIVMLRHLRPVCAQYGTAPRVDLHLPDDGHPGTFEPEPEPADTGEQFQYSGPMPTDDDGMFTVRVPLGLRGPLTRWARSIGYRLDTGTIVRDLRTVEIDTNGPLDYEVADPPTLPPGSPRGDGIP